MKQKKTFAVLLAAVMALSPITGSAYVTGETTWTTDQTEILKIAKTNNINSFNWLGNTSPTTFKYQANFIDPLVLVDADNNTIPGIAESWECNEDASVWTFYLRDDATWVDYEGNYKADVVADDFLYGLEWVLNFWKNDGVNTSRPCSMIKGAQEYYEYTQSLTEEEGLATGLDKFRELVEIEEPDDHTLIYNLTSSTVYFDSVVTGNGFWPMSNAMIEEIGVDGFLTSSYDTIWYCGPYRCTRFIDGNSEIYTRNESYWNKDTLLYDEVQLTIVESNDVAYELYQEGENDFVELTAAYITMMEGTEMYDHIVKRKGDAVVWSLIFNYDKYNQDDTPDENWNKAVANEAFRKCIYYGCDFTNYLTYSDPINPMSQANMTLTPYGVAKFSDGSDYTDRVLELIGLDRDQDSYPHMDADLFTEYKEEAMEELTAEGVTFPIEIDLWCSSEQTNEDQYTIIKETLENNLGTDFVTVTINTYVTSARQEYITPGYYSMAFDGEGVTYMDPVDMLQQLNVDYEEADLVNTYGNVTGSSSEELLDLFYEFRDMVTAADELTDLDERYEAFAQAEAFAIEHALIIPIKSNNILELINYNQYSSPSMLNDYLGGFRYEGMEYKEGGYTTEDYELFERKYLGLE